jgi:hypothetical protein
MASDLAGEVRRAGSRHDLDQRTISRSSSTPPPSSFFGEEFGPIAMTIVPSGRISTAPAPACFAARMARARSAWVRSAGRRGTYDRPVSTPWTALVRSFLRDVQRSRGTVIPLANEGALHPRRCPGILEGIFGLRGHLRERPYPSLGHSALVLGYAKFFCRCPERFTFPNSFIFTQQACRPCLAF